ncbi:MAG: hypothetical protein B7Y45_06635 [Sphingomonas sp. 28-66-16]|nr:MAG: hypothetical protein B7Y45_06635 [Sphingomonas sp. 28-66-16]
MAWKQLSSWFVKERKPLPERPMPLTMVTLRGIEGANADEIAFYAEAELDALVGWAQSGRLVLAFAAVERDEINLMCSDPIDQMRRCIDELPLVAAGLVEVDMRVVLSLRLNGTGPASVH